MTQKQFFPYGDVELQHLKSRDKKLSLVIERVGFVSREVYPDLFPALIKSIVGQQISSKAQATVWNRMAEFYGEITPEALVCATKDELQSFGITFRKADYIRGAAQSVAAGDLDLEGLREKDEEDICQELMKLPGIGRWTAEMLMIFSLQRPNIVSFGDLAILKGMCSVYHHRKITKALFAKYKRRYSPYGSVASFYLWTVASEVPGAALAASAP
jgi:DNA-3-methyladenine glycosylase II